MFPDVSGDCGSRGACGCCVRRLQSIVAPMIRKLLLVFSLAGASLLAHSQSPDATATSDPASGRNINAADYEVGLGPEQIVNILRKDAGLLLVSKRVLVRAA